MYLAEPRARRGESPERSVQGIVSLVEFFAAEDDSLLLERLTGSWQFVASGCLYVSAPNCPVYPGTVYIGTTVISGAVRVLLGLSSM